MALNPFASVRGRKHAVVDGKTPELTIQQARALLCFLDRSNVVGLRDRVVLGVLTYTGARVGPWCGCGAGISSTRKRSGSCGLPKREGLTDRPMTAHGVRQMLKRRLKDAGLPEIITPHSFRVMVVTDLLGQNVPMEDMQYLAGGTPIPRPPRSMIGEGGG